MNLNNQIARHSRAGGNPARTSNPRSGQNEPSAASFEERPNYNVVPLRGRFIKHLDSRLTVGQFILSLSKGGNDAGLCAEMAA